MNKILVIGCTEITKVIIPYLSSDPVRVNEICIASKEKEECDELKKKYKDSPVKIITAGVDVTNEEKALLMMRIFGPTLIVNLAPSYLNKTVMNIALKIGASYIDSAYYSDESGRQCLIEEQFEMSSQFFAKKLSCVTGCSFDLAAYVSLARLGAKSLPVGALESVDIVDITTTDEEKNNKTPSINDIRRLSEPLRYIENGEFMTAQALSIPAKFTMNDYSTDVDCFDHKLLDAIKRGMPEAKNVCYFSQVDESFAYLVRTLDSIGMLSKEAVEVNGASIAPIDYLEAVIPSERKVSEGRSRAFKGVVLNSSSDNASVLAGFECKTWDQPSKYEVSSDAFFNGIAILAGTLLLGDQKWSAPGVFTPGDFEPDELIGKMKELGLKYIEETGKSPLEILA